MNNLILISKILSKLRITRVFEKLRVLKYLLLSDVKHLDCKGILNQPTIFSGPGKIIIAPNAQLGYKPAPFFYCGYMYLSVRSANSVITVDEGAYLNNNCVIVSEGEGVYIGKNTLVGTNVSIYDSDFHNLDPNKRTTGIPNTAKVTIEDNVFLGSNVCVLKGVTIGKNSVIANGSVVTKSIPDNVIAAGVPAKVIKEL